MKKPSHLVITGVLALAALALIPALLNGNPAAEPDTTIPPEIDQTALIAEASEYFRQMCEGDFSTFHEALPRSIRSQTAPETIQSAWEDEARKVNASPSLDAAEITFYRPEFSDQLRVEFSVPGEKAAFAFSSIIPLRATCITTWFGCIDQRGARNGTVWN